MLVSKTEVIGSIPLESAIKNRSELSGIPPLRLVHEYLELIEHLSGQCRLWLILQMAK